MMQTLMMHTNVKSPNGFGNKNSIFTKRSLKLNFIGFYSFVKYRNFAVTLLATMTRQKPLHDIIGDKCIGSNSFRHIYEEHWPDLFSLAVVILRDEDAAKDAVQDIFVSILKKENTDEIQNIKSYLFQSLRHQCFMRLRSIRIASKHRENVSVQLQENTTDHAVDFHFSNLDMERTIASLPGKCREIFLLSRFSDLSNKEIADQLNISSKTVENQITRAIRTLRLSLAPKCLWLGVLSLIIK